ncbi:MAG: hypothetical protein K8J08_13290 [Thermoanaerobaculia bacterium]|nr:hypothetical protein [Thermoanaerobaculia bacterium]
MIGHRGERSNPQDETSTRRRLRLQAGPWIGFALPFPTLRVFRTHRNSLLLTSSGVFLRTSSLDRPPSWYQITAFEFYRWDDLEPGAVRVEGSTLVLRGHRIPFPSVGHARAAARTLLQLRGLPADARLLAAEGASLAAFDLEALQERWQKFEPAVHRLRRAAVGYSALLLAGGLAVTFAVPDPKWLRGGLLLTALAYGVVLTLLIRARRHLVSNGTVEAAGVVVGAIMSPPGAALSSVQLGRDLFRGFDALTLAAAMAPPEITRTLITRELEGVDLAMGSRSGHSAESTESSSLTPQHEDQHEDQHEAWLEAWSTRAKGLEVLIADLGWDPATLRQPPTTRDLAATAYCVLCRGVFQEIGRCPDCELPLEPLPPPG